MKNDISKVKVIEITYDSDSVDAYAIFDYSEAECIASCTRLDKGWDFLVKDGNDTKQFKLEVDFTSNQVVQIIRSYFRAKLLQ